MPSTIVARRLLGCGAASSGVAGDCRTRGPLGFGMGLRGSSCAGAEVDRAERFGVDFELAEDTVKLGIGLVVLVAANFDLILSLSPA